MEMRRTKGTKVKLFLGAIIPVTCTYTTICGSLALVDRFNPFDLNCKCAPLRGRLGQALFEEIFCSGFFWCCSMTMRRSHSRSGSFHETLLFPGFAFRCNTAIGGRLSYPPQIRPLFNDHRSARLIHRVALAHLSRGCRLPREFPRAYCTSKMYSNILLPTRARLGGRSTPCEEVVFCFW